MTTSEQTVGGGAQARTLSLPWIVAASSVGTLIEWYDFYLYGTLAVFFARYFFPPGNDNLALLARLAVFWFGFILRPFGAIFFGHLGDLIGRKFTFMLTLGMMARNLPRRRGTAMTKDGKPAIFASALGTVFERHDFYLYATLAPRCRDAMKP